MADGNEYNLLLLRDKGPPVEVVYATEGLALIIVRVRVPKAPIRIGAAFQISL